MMNLWQFQLISESILNYPRLLDTIKAKNSWSLETLKNYYKSPGAKLNNREHVQNALNPNWCCLIFKDSVSVQGYRECVWAAGRQDTQQPISGCWELLSGSQGKEASRGCQGSLGSCQAFALSTLFDRGRLWPDWATLVADMRGLILLLIRWPISMRTPITQFCSGQSWALTWALRCSRRSSISPSEGLYS